MIFKIVEDETSVTGQKIVNALQARKMAQDQLNASIAQSVSQLEIDRVALEKYEQACIKGSVSTDEFKDMMQGTSVQAKEYAVQTQGATGSAETFVAKQKQTQKQLQSTAIASKLASVSIKALSMAFNMFAGLAIGWAVGKLVEGFEEYSKSAQNAKEKLEEIKTELSDNNSTYQSNRNKLEELKDEYDALTKKAKTLGGVQNLANDEYDRYQEITSQILGITPKLVTGWNNEGEAISNKNDLLQQSIDLLDEEYEKSLRNNTTKSKNKEVASGVLAKLDEFNNSSDTKTRSNTTYEM